MLCSSFTGAFFLRTTETSNGKETRDLLTPAFAAHAINGSCLHFHYFMLSQPADEMATMSVLLLNASRDDGGGDNVISGNSSSLSRHFLWGVRGVTDIAWHRAQAVVPPGEYFRLLIEVNGVAVRGGVDDITLVPGTCDALGTCLSDVPLVELVAWLSLSYRE